MLVPPVGWLLFYRHLFDAITNNTYRYLQKAKSNYKLQLFLFVFGYGSRFSTGFLFIAKITIQQKMIEIKYKQKRQTMLLRRKHLFLVFAIDLCLLLQFIQFHCEYQIHVNILWEVKQVKTIEKSNRRVCVSEVRTEHKGQQTTNGECWTYKITSTKRLMQILHFFYPIFHRIHFFTSHLPFVW